MTQDHDRTAAGTPAPNVAPKAGALGLPVTAGDRFESSWLTLAAADARRFRDEWDPLPGITDSEADASPVSAHHLLCVRQVLMREAPWHDAMLRPLRFGGVSFLNDVRPGSRVRLLAHCSDVRAAGNEVHAVFESTLERCDGAAALTLTEVIAFRTPAAGGRTVSTGRPQVDDDTAYRLATSLALMHERGVDDAARLAHVAARNDGDEAGSRELLAQFEAGYSAGRRSALGVAPAETGVDPDSPLFAIARQMGVQSVETMMAEDRALKARRQQRTRLTAATICAGAVLLVLILLVL